MLQIIQNFCHILSTWGLNIFKLVEKESDQVGFLPYYCGPPYCICVRWHVCLCVCVYVYLCVCVYVYLCVCVYVGAASCAEQLYVVGGFSGVGGMSQGRCTIQQRNNG